MPRVATRGIRRLRAVRRAPAPPGAAAREGAQYQSAFRTSALASERMSFSSACR